MSPLHLPNMDKAAIVLCGLSPVAAESVLGMLDPAKTPRLRQLMATYRGNALLNELAESVNLEFSQLRTAVAESWRWSGGVVQPWPATRALGIEPKGRPGFIHREAGDTNQQPDVVSHGPSNDKPSKALRQIDSAVLARVLAHEHPRVVAIALHHMELRQATEVMQRLGPDARRDIFLRMAQRRSTSSELVQQVLAVIVEACGQQGDIDAVLDAESQMEHLVGLLHGVDREERNQWLAALASSDPEAFNDIDSRLYDFTDLLSLADVSFEKLLAEIDLKVMATALTGAAPAIYVCVMGHVSQRTRLMLQEEIEFLRGVDVPNVEQARREICAVIRQHDLAGTLVWKPHR